MLNLLVVLFSFTSVVIALAVPYARDVLAPLSSNINNCSGNVPPAPGSYDSYFLGYTQQTKPHQLGAWESWTFALHGATNNSLSVLTWTLGDPAASISNPDGLATFSVLASHTNFSAVCKDTFVYKQVDNTFVDIGIGNNHLVFDGSIAPYGAWNISVDIQGFKLNVATVPVPRAIPFTPTHNNTPSQLVTNYFTNIPVTRGHTDGPLTYPTGEQWLVRDVSTIRHSWATSPAQALVPSYTRGSTFVLSSALSWFKAKSITTAVTDSAQLVVGLSGETFDDIPVIYQVTDDSSLVTITPSGLNTTLVLEGCPTSQSNAYVLDTYPYAYRGSFVDSAGGVTKYYSTLTDASIWTGDSGLYVGNNSLGLIEVYTAAGY